MKERTGKGRGGEGGGENEKDEIKTMKKWK